MAAKHRADVENWFSAQPKRESLGQRDSYTLLPLSDNLVRPGLVSLSRKDATQVGPDWIGQVKENPGTAKQDTEDELKQRIESPAQKFGQ
jgi:hypothetical protein